MCLDGCLGQCFSWKEKKKVRLCFIYSCPSLSVIVTFIFLTPYCRLHPHYGLIAGSYRPLCVLAKT